MFTEKDKFKLYERLASTPLEREMLKDFRWMDDILQSIRQVADGEYAVMETPNLWIGDRIREIEEYFD